jgi:diguanylate cyclase (GGDEF)-like protein
LKTILCVDDIEANLFTLEAILKQKKESYSVLTAQSGQEALNILLYQHIDMILLDIMMPEMDGFETAQLILRNKKTKNIPIIFVTAKQDDETIAQCYTMGGVDYLNKPYSAVELFARVAFHLELIEEHKRLEKERDFAQNILDTQDNILLVTDGNGVKKVNKSLLKFFDITTKEEFIKKHNCICKDFLKEEGCFYLDLVPKGTFWLEFLLQELKQSQQIVAIKESKSDEIAYFSLDVNILSGYYLLSLTDITQLNEASNAFKYSAFHDSLTGIYNRQRLNLILSSKLTRESSFAFLMLDIDNFKRVNDKYGHLVGDNILKELTQVIGKKVRQNDVFARWGGEEFVVILDCIADITIAQNIAEHIREYIEIYSFPEVEKVTCSFGVTIYKEKDSLDDITKRADEALYAAKEKGRNRVCIST